MIYIYILYDVCIYIYIYIYIYIFKRACNMLRSLISTPIHAEDMLRCCHGLCVDMRCYDCHVVTTPTVTQ